MKTRLVEEYFKSSLNQRRFSKQNGVDIHTLSGWITEQVSLIPLEAAVKALAISNEEPSVQSDITQNENHSGAYEAFLPRSEKVHNELHVHKMALFEKISSKCL